MTFDHEQAAKTPEPGDDIFGDAVAEMAEGGVAAEIGEWQYRDRRSIGRSLTVGPERRRGHAIGEDIAVELLGLCLRRDLEILLEDVATDCVGPQCFRAVAFARVKPHEGAIDGLA